MHILKRITAFCLSLLLMMSAAQAEIPFLVHSKDWDLSQTPVEVLLKADVETHMPFDDERVAMLTTITDVLTLRLVAAPEEGLVAVGVAGEEVLTLQYHGNDVQLSSMPELTYTSAGDTMSLLLGAETSVSGYEALGLSPKGESLLTDAHVLLQGIPTSLEKYGKRTACTNNISGYGKAAYRMDFTFTSGKGKVLHEGLIAACPEGWLKEILSGLTFSGKQTLRIYYDANDVPLRVEFNGSCGPEGDIRTVKLVWRTRHDGEMDKESIELTTPAKKGKNKNNLTFDRTVTTDKRGARTLTGSFNYTVTVNNVTSIRKGDFNLINTYTDSADVISGSFTLQTKLNDAAYYTSMTIAPELTVTGTESSPVITGWVNVTEQVSGKVSEQVKIGVDLKLADPLVWKETGRVVILSALEPAALQVVQQDVAASVATALVRPLILLLGEDAQYFFRDLPADAVQSIIDAAANSHDSKEVE